MPLRIRSGLRKSAESARRERDEARSALALAQRGEAEARAENERLEALFQRTHKCHSSWPAEVQKTREALHCPPETDLAAWAEYVGRVYKAARKARCAIPMSEAANAIWRTLDSGPRATEEKRMAKTIHQKARQQKICDAISRLAGLFEYGELLAETDPASLLNTACDEIERLRAERVDSGPRAGGEGKSDG